MVRYQGCATEHSIRYVQLLLRKTAVCDCRYFQHIKARGAYRLPHVNKEHTIKCDLKVRNANAQSGRAGSNEANEQTATDTQNGQPEATCKQSSNAFNKLLTQVLFCDRNDCEPGRESLSFLANSLAASMTFTVHHKLRHKPVAAARKCNELRSKYIKTCTISTIGPVAAGKPSPTPRRG